MVYCETTNALNEADIICTATNASEPLFKKEDVKKGAHINAIGSFQPHMQELDPWLIKDARVFVDHRESCLKESGDLIKPIQQGIISENHIAGEIGELLLNRIAGRETEMPFTTISSLPACAEETDADMGDLGLIWEKCISGNPGEDLNARMIENVSALMESKSAMEVIVAAPTAGSCGTVGGSLKAVSDNLVTSADKLENSADELVKAYFAAGIVGAYFAQGPGFPAEEHGCQVECGAASGMAAAGIVQLLGGTAKQAIDAASMAIQNMIGLICDPVADRVEIPCLGKNISAAVNAYASAIMSISGFDCVIPLDQVIQTVSDVGKTMPSCVKCTGKGGLAVTETALRVKNRLGEL